MLFKSSNEYDESSGKFDSQIMSILEYFFFIQNFYKYELLKEYMSVGFCLKIFIKEIITEKLISNRHFRIAETV